MEFVERERRTKPAYVFIVLVVVFVVAGAAIGGLGADRENPWLAGIGLYLLLKAGITARGLFIVNPNESKVLVLFGTYKGTVRQSGVHWANPLYVRQTVSLRIRNQDSDVLKVNDAAGNPVEIAAVINWQVVDTAKALFDVEEFEGFVSIQTETAVRHVASEYPYDNYEDDGLSLRGNADQVALTLQNELQDRLRVAGVEVLDTRLRRLAYAPEIAGEMLRRQQAGAIVAARHLIVEGAVGMVDHALQMLSEQQIVELDEERKAAMVSNLLVVLCSDRGAQPVVNSGSLYG
jgi:regulator of protease activity HflC (stomatin/prohibitin superfamily)